MGRRSCVSQRTPRANGHCTESANGSISPEDIRTAVRRVPKRGFSNSSPVFAERGRIDKISAQIRASAGWTAVPGQAPYRRVTMRRASFVVIAAAIAANLPSQGVIHLYPDKDNTLYQSSTGTISNGKGPAIFCGLTNMSQKRRALLHFDVANNLPPGSTVVSATLNLEMNQTAGGP